MKLKHTKTFLTILFCGVLNTTLVFADAPIVDIAQQSNNADQNVISNSSSTDSGVQTKALAPEPMFPEANSNTTNTKPVIQKQKIKTVTSFEPNDTSTQINTSNLTTEQRLSRLEQQLNNLAQMNLPARLDSLQQEVDKINGQTEQHDHDLKALNDQLRSFYSDLEKRINQTKGINPSDNLDHSASSSTSLDSKDVPINKSANLHSGSSTLPTAGSAVAEPDQQSVPKEQKAYDEAFAALQQKKYDLASDKLRTYIKTYPKGTYIIYAHYWLAECYYILNQLNAATTEFKFVLDKYPSSTKTPDALLKLGMIHSHTGKTQLAKSEFLKVKQRYPGTTAAQLAAHQLNSIGNEIKN